MISPNPVDALLREARGAAADNRIDQAILSAAEAARRDPARHDAWRLLGALHYRNGAHEEASAAFRNALRANPSDAALFHDLGVSLKHEGRSGEAEAMLRESLRRNPDMTASAISLGDLLTGAGRLREAEQIYREAIARKPSDFQPLREFTNLLMRSGRVGEAIALLQQFVARNATSVDALEQMSVALQVLEKLDEALEITQATIGARPPKTLDIRLASYMSISGRLARLDHRERALSLVLQAMGESLPEDNPARWRDNDVNALRRFAFLFPYFGIEDRTLMRLFRAIGDKLHARAPRPLSTRHEPSGQMRVGFVSYNFSEHPIGHLLSPFFERHAETGADLYLYALHLNASDPHDYAGRIRATTPNYRDCRGMGAAQLAARIRADNISILIDLDGYLAGGSPEALAMRPAPVQIHWLQHLAGMPAPYIDYTIVDRILVPDDARDLGSGPLIRLADAFQCGDRVPLPVRAPPRADHGLPEDAFVFCAFGNWLKVDEAVFRCWLDILEAVAGSVLWLSDGPSERSKEKLRDRLAERGLARERLVFAPRIAAKAGHLDRHRCADLFLDTFAFSAATTTTDALWAGLPVLTRPGATAQSRLSASLLKAVGLTQTIVRDENAYVEAAVRLARNPQELAGLKWELRELLPASALYDAGRMAAQFREIYARVWERHVSGASPEHMDISLG